MHGLDSAATFLQAVVGHREEFRGVPHHRRFHCNL